MPTEVTISPDRGHALLFTQEGVGATPGYDAIDLRRMAMVAGRLMEGVLNAQAFKVREPTAGASMQIIVDAHLGMARVDGETIAVQGPYGIAPHTAAITLDVPPADPTNPRVDRVVLAVRDSTVIGGALNDARVVLLQGMPTAGATLDNPLGRPALPNDALHLADLEVPAGATSVPNTKIRDYRLHAGAVEVGTMRFTCGTAKDGEVLADGFLLRRAVHHRLFAEIGTAAGVGDGATTFGVGDLRGRAPVGAGGVAAGRLASGDAVGSTIGSERVALSTPEMPPHFHEIQFEETNLTPGGGLIVGTFTGGGNLSGTTTEGGGQSHYNMQPSFVGRWLIYTGSVA